MTAHTPLEIIRSQFARLSMDDQLSLMCDLVQGGHRDLSRSDDFIDALLPVDAAFCDAFAALQFAADPKGLAA